jgi:hypothetical protein
MKSSGLYNGWLGTPSITVALEGRECDCNQAAFWGKHGPGLALPDRVRIGDKPRDHAYVLKIKEKGTLP